MKFVWTLDAHISSSSRLVHLTMTNVAVISRGMRIDLYRFASLGMSMEAVYDGHSCDGISLMEKILCAEPPHFFLRQIPQHSGKKFCTNSLHAGVLSHLPKPNGMLLLFESSAGTLEEEEEEEKAGLCLRPPLPASELRSLKLSEDLILLLLPPPRLEMLSRLSEELMTCVNETLSLPTTELISNLSSY